MALFLPPEQGIVDVIQDQLVVWLVQKLITDVDVDDAARVSQVHVGPREFAPAPVLLLVYENEIASPREWKHEPEVSRRRRYEGSGGVREFIGGGHNFQRAFTVGIQVWGREIAITVLPRDIGHIMNVVSGRVLQALMLGGQSIGTGNVIEDSFSEGVVGGPFFGPEWAVRQEGKSLNAEKKLQFWYRTQRGF